MAWIIGAVYVIIMVESMTAGVALYFAIKTGMESIYMLEAETRTVADALSFAFLVVAFAGYVFSIPSLCYAVHKRHADWLYPYIVWRLLLLILIIAMTIYLVVEESSSRDVGPDIAYSLIPVGIECVLGGLFFWLAFLALRQFAKYRITTIERLLDS